jgi:hypothetical protein
MLLTLKLSGEDVNSSMVHPKATLNLNDRNIISNPVSLHV